MNQFILLLSILTDVANGFAIAGSIASIITALSLISTIIVWYRNRLNANTFPIEIFLTAAQLTKSKTKAIWFDITFKNKTNKEFSIIDLNLKYLDKLYPVFKGNTDINYIVHENLLTNIPISPNKSITCNGLLFDSNKFFNTELPIEIIVNTTLGTFNYHQVIDFDTSIK